MKLNQITMLCIALLMFTVTASAFTVEIQGVADVYQEGQTLTGTVYGSDNMFWVGATLKNLDTGTNVATLLAKKGIWPFASWGNYESFAYDLSETSSGYTYQINANADNRWTTKKYATKNFYYNKPPVINSAGTIFVMEGESHEYIIDATDEAGIATYHWKVYKDGSAVSTYSSSLNTYSYTATNHESAYIIEYGVTDIHNAGTVYKTLQIDVDETIILPPVINLISVSNSVQEGTTETISADVTDPMGGSINYNWVIQKNGVIVKTSNLESFTYNFATTGTYTVTLTASNGATDTETTTVTVTAAPAPTPENVAPVISGVTADCIDLICIFTGSATDANGDSLTYSWDFADGNTGTGKQATNTYATATSYMIELTVSDGTLSDNLFKFITVTSGDTPPVTTNEDPTALITSDDTATPTYTFDGSDSFDSDGLVESYAWTVNYGAILDTDDSFTYTFTVETDYTVTLTVTDNEGATDSEEFSVFIEEEEPTPEGITVEAGSRVQAEVDEVVYFYGTASDPDGIGIALYEWDFDRDGYFEYSNQINGDTTFIYDEQGTYSALFRVTDANGATYDDTKTVSIGNEENRPFVNAGSDMTVDTLEIIEFRGTANPVNDNGFITSYEWDFEYNSSDGFDADYTSTRDASTTHTYYRAGTYRAALRATDEEGNTEIDYLLVRVIGEDIDEDDTEGLVNYNFNMRALDVRRHSEYDFEDATTTVKLKITNLDDEDRSFLVRDIIPKDFAEYYDDFDVSPTYDIIYNTDPELGWNMTIGAYETAYIEYTFFKFISAEDIEDDWESPSITEYEPEEIAEPVEEEPEVDTADATGLTGLVIGVMDAASLSTYAVIIIIVLIVAFWKKEWITEKLNKEDEEDEE